MDAHEFAVPAVRTSYFTGDYLVGEKYWGATPSPRAYLEGWLSNTFQIAFCDYACIVLETYSFHLGLLGGQQRVTNQAELVRSSTWGARASERASTIRRGSDGGASTSRALDRVPTTRLDSPTTVKNHKEPGESLPMTPNFKDILQAAGECEASCSKAEVLDASPTSPQPVVLQPMWLSALNRENSTSASAAHDTRGSAPAPQGASGRFVSVLHV